jgi:nucleoid-associated protein YgaU
MTNPLVPAGQVAEQLPNMYYNQALELARSGSLAAARDKLLAALALAPEMADAHVVLGKVYAQLGAYQQAIACCEAALTINPEHDGAKRAQSRARQLMAQQACARMGQGILKAALAVAFIVLGVLIPPTYRALSERYPQIGRPPQLERVRLALRRSDALKGAKLDVSVHRRAVRVRGTVDTDEERELVAALVANNARGHAADLSSVSVTHESQVASFLRLLNKVGAGRFESLQAALERGALHLTGNVPSEEDRRLLKELALAYAGVPKVDTSGLQIGRVCIVQPGDSLWALALRYYGNGNLWRRIVGANPGLVSDVRGLRVGATLRIPGSE